MRYYFLDNNIFNFAVTGAGGSVIAKINESIAGFPELRQADTAFCMTPFSLLEALGTKLPDIKILPDWPKGLAATAVVGDVVARAKQAYLALPELSQATIVQRIQERRSYIPTECQGLFDICVTDPGSRPETPVEIANVLAWDYALKVAYPSDKQEEVLHFFFTVLVAAKAGPLISRFRIIKRIWDRFYQNRAMHLPGAEKAIEDANQAMRLKTARDFVDCDLLHLACFGWSGHDVVAFTCDPPDVICGRIGVYKGILEIVRKWGSGLPAEELPVLKDGRMAFCSADGEIRSVVRIEDVPRIG